MDQFWSNGSGLGADETVLNEDSGQHRGWLDASTFSGRFPSVLTPTLPTEVQTAVVGQQQFTEAVFATGETLDEYFPFGVV